MVFHFWSKLLKTALKSLWMNFYKLVATRIVNIWYNINITFTCSEIFNLHCFQQSSKLMIYMSITCYCRKPHSLHFMQQLHQAVLNVQDRFLKLELMPMLWMRRIHMPLTCKLVNIGELPSNSTSSIEECLKNVKKSFHPCRAADKGHYEVIRVLASYGADLGKVNTNGNTSLHIAATRGYGQICKYLAQRGDCSHNIGVDY